MNDDLIKRSDAAEVVYKALKTPPLKGVLTDTMSLAIALVRDIPSADRPQGEWIEVRAFDAFGGDEAAWMAHGNPIAFHYCSECKEQTRLDEFGEEVLSKYYPNCGADMRGINNVKD